MKQGLTYISDRGNQFRFANKDGVEEWVQPLSQYTALETIKRGQVVSVAAKDDFTRLGVDGGNDPVAYVVLTDTQVHKKCIGLALEPAKIGEVLHVQSFGKFTFDAEYEKIHTGKEYNPKFSYNDVGKKVFVASSENGLGTLTTDEDNAYKNYHNIIQIGYLTDAPIENSNQTITSLEILIQGDDRGAIDSTQFECVLGEDIIVPENDQIRVLAVGREEDTNFSFSLPVTPLDNSVTDNDFIAIQKLDGKTCYLNFSGDILDLGNAHDINDKTFINTAKVYEDTMREHLGDSFKGVKIINVNLTRAQTPAAAAANNTVLSNALRDAWSFLHDGGATITTKTHDTYFGLIEFASNEPGGYFTLHISESMKSFFDGAVVNCVGSYENRGKAVLADIRIPSRHNVLGVYCSEHRGLIEKDTVCLFMRMGEITISQQDKEYESGEQYYLGFNGTITKFPHTQYEYVDQIGLMKTRYKLVVDVKKPTIRETGEFPVGYMKPAVLSDNGAAIPEYGFVLMDDRITYPIEGEYNELYQRLLGWFSAEAVNVTAHKFKVPTVTRSVNGVNVPMQIKYLANGIYEKFQRQAFLRDIKTFATQKGNENTKAKFEDFDITALVDYGVNDNGYRGLDIDNLDIRLFVDMDDDYTSNAAHNWVEIKEGFFNFDNSKAYGFQWEIVNEDVHADYAPYGKWVLKCNIGESDGIAYVSDKNQAPIRCNGKWYKLYVARREHYTRQFDLRGVVKNYITNSVYTDETHNEVVAEKAVTGKAVVEAIENRYNVKRIEADKNADITFGSENKLVENFSVASSTDVVIHSGTKVVIQNTFEDANLAQGNQAQRLVFKNNFLTYENYDSRDIFSKASDTAWEINDNDIATVKDARAHAEVVLKQGTNSELLNYIDKDENNGLIHGMVFGIGGNVNAAQLCGLVAKRNPKETPVRDDDFSKNDFIPYVYELDNKTNLDVIGNLNFKYVSDETAETYATQEFSKPTTGEEDVVRNLDVKANKFTDVIKLSNGTEISTIYSEEDGIQWFNKDGDPINTLQEGSLSKYKRIYEEWLNREFVGDLDADSDASYGYTSILGSALQAAYELPMAYWQYRATPESYKKQLGIIVERVNEAAEFEYEKEGDEFAVVVGENSYNYTKEEADSIRAFLKDLTNDSETAFNVASAVGLLLKAAQESQERLLLLEGSTFGKDAETIPGGAANIKVDIKGVTQDPTTLGLNRLIRAICIELYGTADPAQVEAASGTVEKLSRLDELEREHRGYPNNDESAGGNVTAKNKFESISSTTYPYQSVVDDAIENTSSREDADEDVKATGINVETREKMDDPESGIVKKNVDCFNGTVDAIYRITTKLNTLTTAVNGADNICDEPKRLNTIRQNIENIIQEAYFDGADDTTGELIEADAYRDTSYVSEQYTEKVSRLDKLTDALYNFTIKAVGANERFSPLKTTLGGLNDTGKTYDDNKKISESGREFNGKKLAVKEYTEADVEHGTQETADVHVPFCMKDYDYATLLDVLVDALGTGVLRNQHTNTDDTDINDTSYQRTNNTFTERLERLESALDNVVRKLSRRKYNERDTEFNEDSAMYSIESQAAAVDKWLGRKDAALLPPTGTDTGYRIEWERDVTFEHAVLNKKAIQAGLEDLLKRVHAEEAATNYVLTVLGKNYKHDAADVDTSTDENGQVIPSTTEKYTISDDIQDLLLTVYGTDVDDAGKDANTTFSHRTLVSPAGSGRFSMNNNIIDDIIHEMYYVPQPVKTGENAFEFVKPGTKKSGGADYYDFSAGKRIYDIPNTESSISNGNRSGLFSDIKPSDNNNRRLSRLEILENEITYLRNFIGFGIGSELYDAYKNTTNTGYDSAKKAAEVLFKGNFDLTDSDKLGGVAITTGTSSDNLNGDDDAAPKHLLNMVFNNTHGVRSLRDEIGLSGGATDTTVYNRIAALETKKDKDDGWQDSIYNYSSGDGLIPSIVGYLGGSIADFDFTAKELDKKIDATDNETYNTLHEEVVDHNQQIITLYKKIGTDEDAEDAETIKGRIKKLEEINKDDISWNKVVDDDGTPLTGPLNDDNGPLIASKDYVDAKVAAVNGGLEGFKNLLINSTASLSDGNDIKVSINEDVADDSYYSATTVNSLVEKMNDAFAKIIEKYEDANAALSEKITALETRLSDWSVNVNETTEPDEGDK